VNNIAMPQMLTKSVKVKQLCVFSVIKNRAVSAVFAASCEYDVSPRLMTLRIIGEFAQITCIYLHKLYALSLFADVTSHGSKWPHTRGPPSASYTAGRWVIIMRI